jgi:hypothetical protein
LVAIAASLGQRPEKRIPLSKRARDHEPEPPTNVGVPKPMRFVRKIDETFSRALDRHRAIAESGLECSFEYVADARSRMLVERRRRTRRKIDEV